MLKSVITVVAAFGVLTGAAQAQNYPNKPVRFISAYAPGGGQEVGLRVIATRMTDAGWPAAHWRA